MKKIIFLFCLVLNGLLFPLDFKKEIDTLFDISGQNLIIEPHVNVDDLAGGISSEIFFIKDEQGSLRSIVKALPGSDPLYLREFEAMQLMQRIAFDHFQAPTPLSFKQIDRDDESASFIMMTPAQGTTLNELFKKTVSLKGKERRAHIALLQQAVGKSGEALGDLHHKSASYKKGVATFYKEQREQIVRGFLSIVKNHQHEMKISYDKAEKFAAEILALPSNEKAAIIHGDPHPGNIFFDAASGEVTFIDLNNMSPSLQGPVGGSVVYDYVYTLGYIDQFASLEAHLSDSERAAICSAFRDGYASQMELPPAELIDATFKLFYMDQILCFYNFKSDSEIMTAQAKFFTNFAIHVVFENW